MSEEASANGKAKRVPAVVVGVDGSAGAKEALRWALAEARLRRSPVRAVHVWMFGYIGGSSFSHSSSLARRFETPRGQSRSTRTR